MSDKDELAEALKRSLWKSRTPTKRDLANQLAAVTAERERWRERCETAEKLAYLGDHHFPDATYKARLEELVPTLRAVEAERARLREVLEHSRRGKLMLVDYVNRVVTPARSEGRSLPAGPVWQRLNAVVHELPDVAALLAGREG